MMAELPEQVDALLLAAGVPADEVKQARSSGMLVALLADRFLLPGERTYTLDSAGAAAGVSAQDARRLWRALGFPQPAADSVILSENDVIILRLVVENLGHLSDETVQEARAISNALRRVADVMVDELWRYHRQAGQTDSDAAGALAGAVDMERAERLLLHLLRRQLVASIATRSALATSGASLAVGFVDLVGFTAFAQQLDVGELGRLVERFEATTYDIVADAGGQFVKALGDGVLFTCPTAASAAAVALDCLDAVASAVGPARASITFGRVLVREGDVFGPVVNLASRLVALADPNTAIAPAELGLPGVSLGARPVRDIGDVALVELVRP